MGLAARMTEGTDMDAGTQLMLFSTDNPTVEEALRVFCDVYMRGQDVAQTSRRGYRYDVREWLAHVAVKSVKSISTLSMQRYVSHLDERGLQDSPRKRKVAALATFLRFLEEQGVLPNDFS